MQKMFHNCDECSKSKLCNVIEFKVEGASNQTRYIYYVCDSCMYPLSDIGGTEQLLKHLRSEVE